MSDWFDSAAETLAVTPVFSAAEGGPAVPTTALPAERSNVYVVTGPDGDATSIASQVAAGVPGSDDVILVFTSERDCGAFPAWADQISSASCETTNSPVVGGRVTIDKVLAHMDQTGLPVARPETVTSTGQEPAPPVQAGDGSPVGSVGLVLAGAAMLAAAAAYGLARKRKDSRPVSAVTSGKPAVSVDLEGAAARLDRFRSLHGASLDQQTRTAISNVAQDLRDLVPVWKEVTGTEVEQRVHGIVNETMPAVMRIWAELPVEFQQDRGSLSPRTSLTTFFAAVDRGLDEVKVAAYDQRVRELTVESLFADSLFPAKSVLDAGH